MASVKRGEVAKAGHLSKALQRLKIALKNILYGNCSLAIGEYGYWSNKFFPVNNR